MGKDSYKGWSINGGKKKPQETQVKPDVDMVARKKIEDIRDRREIEKLEAAAAQ